MKHIWETNDNRFWVIMTLYEMQENTIYRCENEIIYLQ